jgi:hypothetical protein
VNDPYGIHRLHVVNKMATGIDVAEERFIGGGR